MNSKVGKIPMEHDEELYCKVKPFCDDQKVPLDCPNQEPSDGKETQGTTSSSNQKDSQSGSEGKGSLVTGVCKGNNGGKPRGVSNSGSGGDDGDDERRRPNVPAGGCQGDNQCYIEGDEKENNAKQDREHYKVDDGNDDDDDKYDDDDGSDNNGIKDEREVCSYQEGTGK